MADIVTEEMGRGAEQALRLHDPEALYEQAPCGYLYLEPGGVVVKANQTICTWTGLSPDDVVGRRTFAELLAPGSRLFHETHVRPLLHMQGEVTGITLDILCADGSRLPVLVSAVMDHDDDGAPLATRVAVFDATERRRYEQELLAAKNRAEESERRLSMVARTLQETLMPPRNPHIDGIDVATAYRPAGLGDEIGGDFYDVFEVADHDWVVAIGDVAGKGAEAAVVATLARHTIRAVAISESSPAAILDHLNQVVLAHPSERHLTALVLRMRRIGDWWDVSMALGGHQPAVVLSVDRSPHTIGGPGYLIGALEDAEYDDLRFELRPGSTVLLHTDGVTEARSAVTRDFYGESRLMRLLHDNVESAEGLVHRVLDDVLAFQDGHATDDIALVALQVPVHHYEMSVETRHRG